MALRQGLASISVRKGVVVVVSGSIVKGGRMDWRGIWQGLSDADFDAFHGRLDWSAADEDLGGLLRRALKATRINVPVPAEWVDGLWSDKARYDAQLADVFGLASTKGLYSGMLACGARWLPGTVVLTPTRRCRGGRFEGIDPAFGQGHEGVQLPIGSSDRELGVAVRVCVSQCL